MSYAACSPGIRSTQRPTLTGCLSVQHLNCIKHDFIHVCFSLTHFEVVCNCLIVAPRAPLRVCLSARQKEISSNQPNPLRRNNSDTHWTGHRVGWNFQVESMRVKGPYSYIAWLPRRPAFGQGRGSSLLKSSSSFGGSDLTETSKAKLQAQDCFTFPRRIANQSNEVFPSRRFFTSRKLKTLLYSLQCKSRPRGTWQRN